MSHEEAEGQDWRSVSTRTPDEATIRAAQERARKPGRGRSADDPAQIPAPGWRDILTRVFWSVPRDRVLSTAGGVAFFALLSTFPGIATIVSLYSLSAAPAVIGQHLSVLKGVRPDGVLDLILAPPWQVKRLPGPP